MSNRTGNLTNYHSHSLYCDGRANMEAVSYTHLTLPTKLEV